MTFDELMHSILALLPESSIGEDNDGQLVVYTNLVATGDGDAPVVSMGDW